MPKDLARTELQQFFGSLIRDLRLRRKMTQSALGQSSTVNRSMISRLERGHVLSLTLVLRLAAGLGVEEIFCRIRRPREPRGTGGPVP